MDGSATLAHEIGHAANLRASCGLGEPRELGCRPPHAAVAHVRPSAAPAAS